MASEDLTVRLLSGSSNGRPIIVTATGTAGTVIHTPSSSTPDLELVTLYAWNIGAATRTLTLEWGHAASTLVVELEPGSGPIQVANQYPIQGASQVVRAFADVTAEVLIIGRVTYYEAPT
jgi:hypothetical protein